MADTLYAWVTDLPDGEVNIIGPTLPGMGPVPFVFASQRMADMVEPIARQHARTHKQDVRLVRFKSDGVLREIFFCP